MDVLKLTTEDYSLLIFTNKLNSTYEKASKRISDITTATEYNFTSSTEIFERAKIENNEEDVLTTVSPGTKAPPLIFENKDYQVEIEFNKNVEDSRVYSKIKKETEEFIERKRHGQTVLVRNLNFRNNIGLHDITIRYTIDGEEKEDILSFEVFPTKLDYKKDYNKILRDIHEEYAYLVLDYLKKTYHEFDRGNNSNDIIWWQVFGKLYDQIISSFRLIIHQPHNRLKKKTVYKKAAKIKKLTPALEEKVAQNRQNESKFYRISEKINTVNTIENQFIKYALRELLNKFAAIKNNIKRTFEDELSDDFLKELQKKEETLHHLLRNPLFKEVERFSGFRQESLVIQNKAGYSSFFRYWVILKKGIDFFKGVQNIELKNIAQLYQIWCFIGIKNMVEGIVDHQPDDVKLAKTILQKFNIIIRNNESSKITFTTQSGERIELFHEYSVNTRNQKSVTSFTVNQRPDIVLKISKSDLKDDYTFTYLFDAKYRLDDKNTNIDKPPEDAINQMHRYRDAIYYQNSDIQKKGKEVIGGYILYPGNGSKKDYLKSDYIKSIDEVNIGAFPLRPNNINGSDELLNNKLQDIISSHSESILKEVTPQKKYNYKKFNPHVLVGIVPNKDQFEYLRATQNPIYHARNFPRKVGHGEVRYVAPYLSKHGVNFYFKVKSFEIQQRKNIFPKSHPLYKNGNEECIAFSLGKRFDLNETHKMSDGNISIFRYTNLFNLRNTEDNKIEPIHFS